MTKTASRVLAILGTLVFLVGWSLVIYLAIDPGQTISNPGRAQRVVGFILESGFFEVTLTAAVLWGVAAYLNNQVGEPPASA